MRYYFQRIQLTARHLVADLQTSLAEVIAEDGMTDARIPHHIGNLIETNIADGVKVFVCLKAVVGSIRLVAHIRIIDSVAL